MKEVLISIQPYWVFLIIAKTVGWNIDKAKTVEVRKNFPKDESWNKAVKIYCSKDKKSFAKIPKEYQPLMEHYLGKVIGEFVCDEIVPIHVFENGAIHIWHRYGLSRACVPYDDLASYIGAGKTGSGWHISGLKIYEKPKSLSDFVVEGDCDCLQCKKCAWFERGNGYNVEDDCLLAYENVMRKEPVKPLFRAPQSWCYVEIK